MLTVSPSAPTRFVRETKYALYSVYSSLRDNIKFSNSIVTTNEIIGWFDSWKIQVNPIRSIRTTFSLRSVERPSMFVNNTRILYIIASAENRVVYTPTHCCLLTKNVSRPTLSRRRPNGQYILIRKFGRIQTTTCTNLFKLHLKI